MKRGDFMGNLDFSQQFIDCIRSHSSEKLEEAEWLLNNVTIDVNAMDKYGRNATALIHAAYYGISEWIDKLLKRGASVDAKDDHGRTALWYASLYGHTDVAVQLIKAGADIHVKDCLETTPIILAAQFKDLNMCRLYLGQGANINDQDKRHHDTPLLMASNCYPTYEKLAFLLDHGADITIKNNRGETALDIVKSRKDCDERIITLLQERMDKAIKPVQIIRAADNLERPLVSQEHTKID